MQDSHYHNFLTITIDGAKTHEELNPGLSWPHEDCFSPLIRANSSQIKIYRGWFIAMRREKEEKEKRKNMKAERRKGKENVWIIQERASRVKAAQPLDQKDQGWGLGMPGGSEGIWENLVAKSTLVCTICTSAPCYRV